MPKTSPQTKASELIDKLNLYSTKNLPSELEFMRFNKEANNILKINPSLGYMIHGFIHTLKGNIEAMETAFEKSLLNGTIDRGAVLYNYHGSLVKLDRPSEALDLSINNYIEGDFDLTSQLCNTSILLGLYETSSFYFNKLKAFPSINEEHSWIEEGINYLQNTGLSEDEVSDVYQFVISVLSKRDVFYSGTSFFIDHDDGTLVVVFSLLDIDSKTLTDLGIDMADELAVNEIAPIKNKVIAPIFQKDC